MIKEYIDKNKGQPMTPEQLKFIKHLRTQVHLQKITVQQAKEQWKARYP